MQFIFLGPPGAGKGTQAETLAQQLGIPHISTGKILREAIAEGTDLGIKAQVHVDKGELVPDSLIIALIRERFGYKDTQKGWILDGFPRNVSQARALDMLLEILSQPYGRVVYFDVAKKILIERMLSRSRNDDNLPTIQRRLKVYREETTPLIDFYQRRRSLVTIDGSLSPSEVNILLQQALDLAVPVAV